MTEVDHLTEAELAKLARPRQALALEELARWDHVTSCPQCQAKVQHTPEFRCAYAALAFDLFPPHLSYGDECKCLNGTLDDEKRRTVEQHMRLCAHCRYEVEELGYIDEEAEEAWEQAFAAKQPC